MTRREYLCTDTSKSVEVILRNDNGNTAGGFTCHESGPRFTATFKQAVGREFVEELAKVFGGSVTWGMVEAK